jgi:hypothetical protein
LPLQALSTVLRLSLPSAQSIQIGGLGLAPELMQGWDRLGIPQELAQFVPDQAVEVIGPDPAGGTLMRPPDGERLMTLALVVKILIPFADALLADGDHPEPTLAAFDLGAQQIAAGGGAIQAPGRFGVPPELKLGLPELLDGDQRQGVTPNPFAFGTIVAPGVQRAKVPRVGFAIARQSRLPMVVASFALIGRVGQDVPNRGGVPDSIASRGRGIPGDIQAFGDLAAG